MSVSRGINAILVLVLLIAASGVAWLYFGHRSSGGNETESAAPVAVIAQQARLQPLKDRIQALGTARASKAVEITPEVAGVIEDIPFRQGTVVAAGEVLVTLEDAEVQARLASARASVAQRQRIYERQRELHQSGLISDAELEQARTGLRTARAEVAVAEAALADHVIRAPFDGRLGLRQVSDGGWVQPGTVITTLDDVTPIEVEFSVPARLVGTLSPGQIIVAESPAYPSVEFAGTVQTVATRVDPVTRTVRVRAVLRNGERLIKPGMLLTIQLIRGTSPALMIPEQAVVSQNDRQSVFVIDNGKARKQAVETGYRRPGQVEITRGLSAGEWVVVEGTLKLQAGTPVVLANPSEAAVEPAE